MHWWYILAYRSHTHTMRTVTEVTWCNNNQVSVKPQVLFSCSQTQSIFAMSDNKFKFRNPYLVFCFLLLSAAAPPPSPEPDRPDLPLPVSPIDLRSNFFHVWPSGVLLSLAVCAGSGSMKCTASRYATIHMTTRKKHMTAATTKYMGYSQAGRGTAAAHIESKWWGRDAIRLYSKISLLANWIWSVRTTLAREKSGQNLSNDTGKKIVKVIANHTLVGQTASWLCYTLSISINWSTSQLNNQSPYE